jgi:uncharacterized membrane protein
MTTPQQRRFGWFVGLLLIAVAASYLRLETVGQRGIWYDETYTRKIARLDSISEVFDRSYKDFGANTPPLHYVLCFLHFRIADSPSSLRLTSVESGVLSVLALVGVGSLLFGPSVGLVAGALMTTCIYHINYSQDARPYALLVFFVVATFLPLFGFLKSGRWRWFFAFVLAATGSVYTHHFAWVFQLCAAATLALAVGARALGRPLGNATVPSLKALIAFSLLAYAAVAVLYIPVMPTLLKFLTGQGSGVTALHTLSLSPGFFWELFGRWGNGTSWSLAYLICFLTGLVTVVRRRDVSLSLLLWFVAPFLVFVLIPSPSRLFDARYVVGALPAFFLLVALGLVSIASLVQEAVVRSAGREWLRRAELRHALLAGLVLMFTVLSLDTYRVFRETTIRCSMFFLRPQTMEEHGGFCRKHIILNSLDSKYAHIWKKHDVSSE